MNPQQFQLLKAPQQFNFTPQAPKKGGRGGTLTSLISEGGAFGGAALGASIGSVVPIAGTALGGIIGGVGGALAGRLTENRVRDDRWGLGDAAKEAAFTGVLGAPGRALKYGVTAGKALKGGGGLAEALAAGANRADAPGRVAQAIKGKVANITAGIRDDAALKNFKLNDSNWISAFQKKVGEDPGAFASRIGFATSTPKQVAKKFYNPLQETYTAHLQQVPAITKGDIDTALKTRVSEYAKSDVAEVRAMGQKLKKASDDLLKRLPDNISALDARAKKAAFQSAVDEKLTDTAGKLANNTNKQIAGVFRDLINDKADAVGIKIDPASLPIPGSKATTLRELGNELRGIKEFSDKAAVKQNVGRGKNPFGLTPLLAGAAGGGAFGPGGALGLAAITGVGNSQVGRKAEYSLAKKLSEIGSKAANPMRTGARIGATGALGEALLGGAQSSPLDLSTSASAQIASPNNTPPMIPNNMPELSQTDANMSTDPMAPENLQSSVRQILANGGSIEDASKFVSLAEALQKIGGAGQSKPLTASQATRAAAANNALRDIPMIADSIETGKLGGAKVLPGSGTQIGRRILGTENLDAALFNIADNILRARTGAAAPEAEVKRFVDTFLPAATDSAQAKRDKLARAIRELQGYVNPMEASADTLEEALLQGAY